jgi:hypothetical protein
VIFRSVSAAQLWVEQNGRSWELLVRPAARQLKNASADASLACCVAVHAHGSMDPIKSRSLRARHCSPSSRSTTSTYFDCNLESCTGLWRDNLEERIAFHFIKTSRASDTCVLLGQITEENIEVGSVLRTCHVKVRAFFKG